MNMAKYKQKTKSVVYRRCEKVATIMLTLGYNNITFHDLKYLIMKHVGADKRTIRAYCGYLVDFGFLKRYRGRFFLMKGMVPLQQTLMEMEVMKK